jgi:glycosyltransferase involved in cell wall biosynthesis
MMSPASPGVVQLVLSLDTGGTERLVVQICQRLQSRFRMAVCTLDGPGSWASEVRSSGIEVMSLFRRPGFHASLGYQVARFARRHRATIIHCHHYSPFVYGRIATWLHPGLRMVFTEHGRLSDGPPSTKRRWINPVLSRFRGSMFAVSGALRDSMAAEGFPAARITVVHNGIDPGPVPSPDDRARARHALGLEDDAVVIGTVARLNPVKDLGTLIEAFQRVRLACPTAVLVLVGDGEERQRLEHVAQRNGVRHVVRFLGERHDARALLPAFDIYANSSSSEGVSLTILEAMAARCAIVATRVGGTPEVLTDQSTGLLVPSRNPDALAEALRTLAANPLRRQTLGEAARGAVERHFTLDRMVDHYAREYLRLQG